MRKFRGRLPRRGPLPFRYVFLLTFVFFIFSTAAGLWIINEGLKPTLVSYANSQTRKIASLVINNAVSKKITNVMDIKFEETGNGDVVFLNAEHLNRVKAEVTELVQDNIKKAEKGDLSELESFTDIEINTDKKENGIVYYVPLGQATNNALLGNLGPKIPIKFNSIGSVTSTFRTVKEEMGINNTWVEIHVQVEVKVQIIIPFATEIITVREDVPVATGLIKGEVPQFYNGGGGDSGASIELPIDN
ncbi:MULTISPECIES: sporulation protein YunB [Robertmurraya]|uniref:Sporulation protein YunB n=1 Tax=Robertmurraya beringensis TaxID=641660 RepID=A0ABV6KYF0_9BACI|nr:sporulation protein YunB [Mycobacteroides abscessus subsp. abscessus]